MKYIFLMTAIGLQSLSRAMAEPELKGSPTELSAYLATLPKLVSVTGEAEIKVPADRASVSLRVRTENKSLQEAMRLNQDIREKVGAFLSGRGVEANRIQSSRFASAQRFGIFSDKAKSHQVEQYLKITVRDEKEFQTVASTVDKWAEVHYGGTEFEHSDKETFKSKALVQAFDRASERKKLIEEKLGVKLTPKRFTQEVVAPVLRNTLASEYAGGRDKIATTATKAVPGDSASSYAAMVDEGQSAFGELVYTARVTVEYTLESK
jgi:uncharacterized protein YggE